MKESEIELEDSYNINTGTKDSLWMGTEMSSPGVYDVVVCINEYSRKVDTSTIILNKERATELFFWLKDVLEMNGKD